MMKKKIISPHSTRSAFRPQPFERGFTLVELAMVLVVLGLLIGLGASLIGPLTKQAKVVESRESVKSAKAALTGYAVKNGFFIADPLGAAGARKLDAWGRNILFYADDNIWGTGKKVCGVTATNTQVKECTTDDCTVFNSKSNIAFIVYSTGQDADGACTGTGVCTGGVGTCIFPTCTGTCTAGVCSGGTGTCPTCTATPGAYCTFPVWQQAAGYNSPCTYTATNPAFQYDDIVQYVTLDEIRSAMGCSFSTTTTLPNVPTTVTATRATLSSINLTWIAPALATTDSALAGYEIDRSTDAGVTYPLLQSIGMGTSFTDPSLSAGQRYVYRMRTVDKAGNESANSLTSSTTVSPFTQTGVIATYTAATAANCGYALAGSPAVQFSILNRGVAGDNGANITVTSMTISWTVVAGGIRTIDFTPGAAPFNWTSATPVASPATVILTTPITINAGITQAVRLCFSTSPRSVANAYNLQINTTDGQFGVY